MCVTNFWNTLEISYQDEIYRCFCLYFILTLSFFQLCFSIFEGMQRADIIRQEIEDLERLLQGNY